MKSDWEADNITVFIDANGCPVVDITVKASLEAATNCVIICDTSHEFEKSGAKTIIVPTGNDSVDFVLVNMIKSGNIVITQDYGLAAMCLVRGAIPISQDGMIYSDNNIDALLMQRHISKKIRMSGGRLKGPSKRAKEQDNAFEKALKELLSKSGG